MAFFGLKLGLDLEMPAAHPHPNCSHGWQILVTGTEPWVEGEIGTLHTELTVERGREKRGT